MVDLYVGKLWSDRNRLAMVLPFFIFSLPLIYKLYPAEDFYYGTDTVILFFLSMLFLVYAVFDKPAGDMRFSVLDGSVAVFLSYCLVNGIIKTAAPVRNFNILLYAASLMLYFSFKKITINKQAANIFILIVLFSITANQLYGFLQLLHAVTVINSQYKATGFFMNPNIFCACLTIQFPLIVYWRQNSNHVAVKILCPVICCIVFFFDFFLESRAAAFALLLTCLALSFKPGRSSKLKTLAGGFFCVCSIAALILFVSIKTASSNGRLLIWKISAGMLTENPVTGIGLGNFKSKYNLYQADYFKSHGTIREKTLAGENYNPFNAFLSIGIEEGIIGLVLFVVLLFLFFSQKSNKDEPSCPGMNFHIKCSVFALLFISGFSYSFEEPFLFTCFFSLLGISASKSNLRTTSVKNVKYGFNLILITFSIVCFTDVYYTNRWLRTRSGMPDGAKISLYRELYPHLAGNDLFLNDYATALAFNNEYRKAEDLMEESNDLLPSPAKYMALALLDDRMNQPAKAEFDLKQAISITPSRFAPRFALFNHYVQLKRYSQAYVVAEEINHMDIKIPSIEIERMRDSIGAFLNSRCGP